VSEGAKRRAAVVGGREDVRRWIKRLRKLAREMPPDVWVFVASGTPTVLATDESGCPFYKASMGADADAVISTTSGGRWDGGDW
jgi:hypothetical protein